MRFRKLAAVGLAALSSAGWPDSFAGDRTRTVTYYERLTFELPVDCSCGRPSSNFEAIFVPLVCGDKGTKVGAITLGGHFLTGQSGGPVPAPFVVRDENHVQTVWSGQTGKELLFEIRLDQQGLYPDQFEFDLAKHPDGSDVAQAYIYLSFANSDPVWSSVAKQVLDSLQLSAAITNAQTGSPVREACTYAE